MVPVIYTQREPNTVLCPINHPIEPMSHYTETGIGVKALSSIQISTPVSKMIPSWGMPSLMFLDNNFILFCC